MKGLNKEVTDFLDQQDHPLRNVIEELRNVIISAVESLRENVKWNGPNYCVEDLDRITMKIYPPKHIQLIFHRGAKKQEQPSSRLIQTESKLLIWKENDRAVASFKTLDEVKNAKVQLLEVVKLWIAATT